MNHFDYRNGVLHAEAVNLIELAEAVGTPFYCYSTATLERHYRVFIEAFAGEKVLEHRIAGSSLKFCLLAEGNAELYPRFGPTSEWDTAAGQAVLEAAGGHVTLIGGHRMRYNCRQSLLNGDFVAFSHESVLPRPA